MEKSAYKIHIIGAGISGLIAAQILENHGYHPIIIEASSTVGGRVKSDLVQWIYVRSWISSVTYFLSCSKKIFEL